MKPPNHLHLVTTSPNLSRAGRRLGLLGNFSPGREPTGSLAAAILRTTVGDVMTKRVQTVEVDLSVESLTWFLLDRGLGGAPVVDGHGKLVGFVSMTDLVRERYDNGEVDQRSPLQDGFFAVKSARSTVGAVMSPVSVTLRASQPLTAAAAVMSFASIQQIPVTDRAKRVVGMISSLDVIRWLSRRVGFASQ